MLTQFQFDASPPQRWYTRERKTWSGITLDSDIRNVIRINLSGSKLVQLPESIGDLELLTDLFLCYNMLPLIPESIGDLNALRNISVSENPVSSTKDKQNEIIRRFARLRLSMDIDRLID